jgi:glycosyltransferase involved in cell wall biosynthesis
MPFFSICIPNFNYSSYLKLTIESVLSQSFQDFEIIVSDNASTDDSVNMVKSFQDSRISLIENQVNLGFSPNLDKCTQNASGEFMILLSSDDVMFPDALETIYQVIKSNNQDSLIVMSACSVIDSNGNKIGSKRAMTGDVYSYIKNNQVAPLEANPNFLYEKFSAKTVLTALLTGTFQPAGQFLATCYSSKLYRKLDGYRSIMSVHPDAHFSQRMLFQNPIVIYINKELFGYRVHEANNLSATLKMANIKYLTDSYLLSKQYDKAQLQSIDLNPEDLENAFINHLIFRDAFWSLARGRAMKGIRLLSFGVAAYPNKVIWNIKFLGLFLMVFTTPILRVLFKLKKLIQGNNN